MSKFLFLIYLLASLTLSLAHATTSSSKSKGKKPLDIVSAIERFSVKVSVKNIDLFTGETSGGHGTGIIIEKDEKEDRLTILTNRHVVTADPLDAQKVTLEIPVEDALPEEVPAEVIFISPITDSALLKCKLSDLKRTRTLIEQGTLADYDDSAIRLKRGQPVIAFGHPHDGENISTSGTITGFIKNLEGDGPHIQVDAPINPGNSGGPLVDISDNDLNVIGMNSANLPAADGTGYALPVSRLVADWVAWKKDRSFVFPKELRVRFSYVPKSTLTLQGYDKTIIKALPSYFEQHKGIVMVSDAQESSNLKRGDLILKVENKVIGDDSYLIDDYVQTHIHKGKNGAPPYLRVTVVRDGQIVKIKSPALDLKVHHYRQLTDFVFFSGIVFQELNENDAWLPGQNLSRVYVKNIVPNSVGEKEDIDKGSLVSEIRIGDNTFKINTLGDFKRALKTRLKGQPVLLHLHPPIQILVSGRPEPIMARDPQNEHYFVNQSAIQSTVVPINESEGIITPATLSLNAMRKGYDFDGNDIEKRTLAYWVKATAEMKAERCTKALKKGSTAAKKKKM